MGTKPEKKKLLGKNIGEKLLDIGLGNPFLDITTKANKETDKLKCFCTSKDIIIKAKAQPIKWEKIFANHISDKGLLSKKHKELIQLNSKKKKKKKIQLLKWAEELKRHSPKEDKQMANRYMKRCSTTSCHGNTNQNNNEIPPYICQNGYHEKDKR